MDIKEMQKRLREPMSDEMKAHVKEQAKAYQEMGINHLVAVRTAFEQGMFNVLPESIQFDIEMILIRQNYHLWTEPYDNSITLDQEYIVDAGFTHNEETNRWECQTEAGDTISCSSEFDDWQIGNVKLPRLYTRGGLKQLNVLFRFSKIGLIGCSSRKN